MWNFFLPDADTGEGLKNLDYAYIAASWARTRSPPRPQLQRAGHRQHGGARARGYPEQKEQWLKPLLDGEIRSASP